MTATEMSADVLPLDQEFVIPRDQWGRPKIQLPNSTKSTGYTRVSTLAKILDSGEGLKKWAAAMTLIGSVDDRPVSALAAALDDDKRRWSKDLDALGLLVELRLSDLVADIVTGCEAHPYAEQKTALLKLATLAQESAGSTVKRDLGTELHYWAAVVDRTGDLDIVPAELRADVDAYLWATAELQMLGTEVFVVIDEIKAAGSMDRLARLPDGRVVVADQKTGQQDCDYPMSVEMQVAMYAHGQRYDFQTRTRTPLHPDIDLTAGVLIHAPSGQARCELYPLDLERGWANVLLGVQVRDARKAAGRKLAPMSFVAVAGVA